MKALITGATGQCAAYLAKHLIDQGHDVVGTIRPLSHHNFWRLDKLGIREELTLLTADLTDSTSIEAVVKNVKPDWLFNLAAASHVGTSFKCPAATIDVNARGPLNIFEAVAKYSPDTRVYQASTSEQFGNQPIDMFGLNELSPMKPVSPYGAAKLCAHNLAHIYRHQGVKISCGIMFNCESPLRGNTFVTQKICKGIAEFKKTGKKTSLGNLSACRDWGHALDYVKAMQLILEHDKPDDFVIATGKTHSVTDFMIAACYVGMVDPCEVFDVSLSEMRPYDLEYLKGDASKIKKHLGWTPTKTFDLIVMEMVQNAL